VVLPQLIKYFEESDRELISLLVVDVLKNDPKYLDLLKDYKNNSSEQVLNN